MAVNPKLERFRRVVRTDEHGGAKIAARHVYIVPTRYGVLFAFAILFMLIGAVNYGSNLGFLFTFLFASIALVGMLHTWRNLIGLQFQVTRPASVFAGNDVVFGIQASTEVADGHWGIRMRSTKDRCSVLDVGPGEGMSTALRRHSVRRGELPLGRIRVSTQYPLGLFRAWCYLDSRVSGLVYPRPSVRAPRIAAPCNAHSAKGDRGEGADDFVGPRPYRPGDSPRHLDWKAYARERGLVTKQFGGDRAVQVWIDWEQLSAGGIEEKLSQMCRLVLDAAGADRSFGLRIPGVTIEPARGGSHKHRALAALARFGSPG